MNNKIQPENSLEAKSEALMLTLADKLEGGIISTEKMIAAIQLFLYQANSEKGREKLN